jgi:hypothetical protein
MDSMMSGGRGVGGWVGGVKKCFLGLRQTALLSAEGNNITFCVQFSVGGLPDKCLHAA